MNLKRFLFAFSLIIALVLADWLPRAYLTASAPPLSRLSHLKIHGNVDHRVTTDQPARFYHSIWLFGNSALLGYGVSESQTIASVLQRRFRNERVVNLAIAGGYVTSEWSLLQQTPVQAGDVVIFIDGGMDLAYGRCMDRRLALLQLACRVGVQLNLDPRDVDHFNLYAAKSEAYARSRGAGFLHFIQPVSDEFLEAYAQGIHLITDTRLLFDEWHLTPAGAAAVAQALYNALTEV